MNLRSAIAFLLVSSAFGSSAAPAMADYVVFAFEGEITSVEDDDNLLGGAVTVGSPFAGTYTFDPLTPDSDPHPRRGLYWDAIIDISGNVGGFSFAGPGGSVNAIEVENDFASSTLDIYRMLTKAEFIGQVFDIGLGLSDGSGSAFSSDFIPVVPPDLTLFDTTRFSLLDTSEAIPLDLRGDVTSLVLVPDPGTLGLLALGAVFVGTRRRVRTKRKELGRTGLDHPSAGSRMCFLASMLTLALAFGMPARAADCNDNGVDDATELVTCPDIEIVFIFDTSSSMGTLAEDLLCPVLDDVIADLLDDGLTASSERLAIEQGSSCFCCEPTLSNVHDRYGDEAIGYPEVPRLGLCNPKQDGNEEDWAPATAIVAANKSWTEGGIRIIVPISDEGPRCGDPVSDPGSDRDAIEAAIDGIHTFSSAASESAVSVIYSRGQFVNTRNKEAE